MKRICWSLLAVSALGCVQPVTFPTPSGGPEAFIEGASKHAVMNAIIAAATSSGWSLQGTSEYQVIVTQPIRGVAGFLMGSEENPVAVWRETFTVLEAEGGIRVIGSVVTVTNPGTGYEETTDVTHGPSGEQMRQDLIDIRDTVLGHH